MKYLIEELKPHKHMIILAFLLGAVVSAAKAAIPEMMKFLIDNGWNGTPPNKEYTLYIPLILAGIWLIASVARYFHMFLFRYVAEIITIKFRQKLMKKYLKLNLSFHQKSIYGSGSLISKMMNDIVYLQEGIHRLSSIIREPILALFTFGYLMYLDWQMTIFIILILPFIVGITRSISRSIRKYSHRSQISMEALTKTLKESLDGKKIVQSYNLEQEMIERFDQQADEVLKHRKTIIKREEASGPITESFVAFAQAALFIYIGFKIIGKELTYGDFTGYMFAIALLQDAVKKTQQGVVKVQQGMVALERLSEIFSSSEEVLEQVDCKAFPKSWDHIKFNNISFSYGEETVLDNVNIDVKKGEVIALVGPSGSGKSTLVSLLERFYDPTNGSITIGGTKTTEMNLKELRSQISYVSQDVFLFNDSVEYNIAIGDRNKDRSLVEEAAKMANSHEFIMATSKGYKTPIGDLGSRLSGGQRQRLSIARALFKNAPILILDEATSALDTESEREVQEGLNKLMKGRTSFVIAHRLSTVVNADRILVLKEGQIVEEGTHLELIKQSGEYAKLYNMQMM